MAQQVFTSTTTWTCPTGVTSIAVWCYGGGGGGGGSSGNAGNSGSGGGGGAFAFANVIVTPGTVYTITVGASGSGGIGIADGSAGGDSWFSTTGTVLAKGGSGGLNRSGGAGNGGASASCVGTIVLSGGNGGTTGSGAGGGAAGWQAAGGNASNATAGAAGNGGVAGNDPGKGGNGKTSGAGAAGVSVGGGGSGSAGGTPGGAGAAGLVALEYGTSSVNQVQLIMAASGATAGTSASVSWPAATTANNLVVATLTNSVNMATLTPPTGWNLAVKDSNPRSAIYYIQNSGSRSGAEAFTISSGRWTLELREYSGILTTSALGGTSSATATSTAVTTGNTSANPLTANDLVVAAIVSIGNNVTFSSITATNGTADFINDAQETTNSFSSYAIVGGLSTGSTAAVSATASASDVYAGVIAIFGASGTTPTANGNFFAFM